MLWQETQLLVNSTLDGYYRMKTVLLIGASNKPTRYSNTAMRRLESIGHRIIPVNPFCQIETEEPTIHHLSLVSKKIDIAVVYVRAEILKPDIEELIRIAPGQVIFSPGTEDRFLALRLQQSGIKTRNACILVLLATGHFIQEEGISE